MRENYTTQYDWFFTMTASSYFKDTNIGWKWFKAQALAESSLNPSAVSPVGAMGLMQLMPFTWQEIRSSLGLRNDPYDPAINITAGIYYDRRIYDIWKAEKGLERIRYMFASYNAGLGNILKAQKLANIPDKWESLAEVLPKVTGRHAEETINYIKRIENYKKEL